jgi:hypothetical protein
MAHPDTPGIRSVLWFLPTTGDSRYAGSDIGARSPTFDYLQQVARAAAVAASGPDGPRGHARPRWTEIGRDRPDWRAQPSSFSMISSMNSGASSLRYE